MTRLGRKASVLFDVKFKVMKPTDVKRLYLTYELWTTIISYRYLCWRHPHITVPSLLCNLSLIWKRRHLNVIGTYVHFFLLPAQDTRLISTSNYHRVNVPFKQPDAHEHYTISLLRLRTKLSIVTFDWSIGGQTFKGTTWQFHNNKILHPPLYSAKFLEAFVSLNSLAVDPFHLITRASRTCLLRFIQFVILLHDHDNNQLTCVHSAM